MTIKKYLLIIFFFIIVFIVFQNLKSINENFSDSYTSERQGEYNFFIDSPSNINSYSSKNMTIQLTNNLLNPLILNFDINSQLQLRLNKKLISLFPLKQHSHENINKKISYTNIGENIISYMNEDSLLHSYLGFKYNKYKNLRYVCAITYSHYTLITLLDSEIKNWGDLENKNIGTIDNSNSLRNLKHFLSVLEYKKSKVTITLVENKEILKELFFNNKIDAIYLTIEHPSPYIKIISKNMKIRLITTEGISESKYNMIFPFIFKGKIDLREYDNFPSMKPMKDTYATRLLLVSNNNTKQEYIYNFLKTFFKNIQFIRKNIKELDILNPTFASFNYVAVPYQKGAEKFYSENSYITYKKNNLCYLYYGTGECNKSEVNRNRFVTNYGNPLNYTSNFTVLSPENKWNNIVNDWDFNKNGKQFKEGYEYINPASQPLLISNVVLQAENNNVFKHFVDQIEKYPEQVSYTL
jgi:TRAP-type uncharacterized transport system substrate-binding protein